MTLEELGYSDVIEEFRKQQGLESFSVGRIILEHKERYVVKTESDELDCELIGNLRFSFQEKSEFPSVGDWVALSKYDDGKALIHAVFPRISVLERKSVGKLSETQIIAANIDVGIIVQSVNRDFSINRLERYLTICNASKIDPIIVLSKIDLIEKAELEKLVTQIKDRIKKIPIIMLSNLSKAGMDEIQSRLMKGKTYCLLGSSGVGKSTLINSLIGEEQMQTSEISDRIDRGKHVTTHRELIVTENGILIDNPGMREIGLTDAPEGFETTFEEILKLAQECKYVDCSHTNEKGCAVLAALEKNQLNAQSYENYLKMEKERAHFESNAQERKKKDKDLGKLIKNMKKNHHKY